MPNKQQNRQAEEQLMYETGRLPPGQVLTRKFPVLSINRTPKFNEETWTFRVFGEVEAEISWTWTKFQQIPTVTLTTDIHCVTGWSKFDTTWEGPRFSDFVGLFDLKPPARFVTIHSLDQYTTNLPLEIVLQDNFLLATHFDGQPLTLDHGYPLRGIVGHIPGRDELITPYFWKGAKWVRGLEFSSEDRKGFWEKAGYHNEADVWKEERFV